MDVSILIPALNEGQNLKILLPWVISNLNRLSLDYEIIIIDGGSRDDTRETARKFNAKVIIQSKVGFGSALRDGFKVANGEFIITMDADLSHSPDFFREFWDKRFDADLIIASRYIAGGRAKMSLFRYILSRILNNVFSFILSLEIKDLSSNFRMYKKAVIDSMQISEGNFDILEEIILKVYCGGWRITEVPFWYQPRCSGKSHVKLMRFAKDYLRTLFKMWQLRNSVYCADYDLRAFYSRIFLQRFWQRRRYNIVLHFLDKKNNFLDIGCGSSKILIDNPDAVGLDIALNKLRYLKPTNIKLVNATAGRIPFKDESFSCIVCSEVIEHTAEQGVIKELYRVLKGGGTLIIGTPDYDKISWRIIEYIYSIVHKGGYVSQHINHYSYSKLCDILKKTGFQILDYAYICNSELIIKACKK